MATAKNPPVDVVAIIDSEILTLLRQLMRARRGVPSVDEIVQEVLRRHPQLEGGPGSGFVTVEDYVRTRVLAALSIDGPEHMRTWR